LSDSAKLAVIGELAEKPRFEGGGSSHVNAHRVVTPKEVMPENAVYAQGYRLDSDQPDEQLTAEAMALAKNSDQVVFFAGFPEAMESEGFDKHSISLPANQNKLLEQLLTVNPHVVVSFKTVQRLRCLGNQRRQLLLRLIWLVRQSVKLPGIFCLAKSILQASFPKRSLSDWLTIQPIQPLARTAA
jgi:Glycosyl hydrolase family 3 C terminal domain.